MLTLLSSLTDPNTCSAYANFPFKPNKFNSLQNKLAKFNASMSDMFNQNAFCL